MSTFQETTNTLLDELMRTGQLTAQAHTYISESCAHYSRRAFWFNEEIATAQTVQDQEYLDLPADWGLEYSLSIEVNSHSYPLRERTWQQMEDAYISSTNYSGYPQDYCIYRGQLRLGPIPNGAYTLKLAYLKQPETLSSDASTNIMLGNIDELIRMRAARRMCRRIIQDAKREAEFKEDELEAYREAKAKTAQYAMTGRSRPRNRPIRNY